MHNRTMIRILAVPALALALASSAALAESTGAYVDDAAITTKVKGAIVADPMLKISQITVHTAHGAVRLSGTVDSAAQKDEAVKDANGVSGVKTVIDRLSVSNTQSQ
ncbi:MAG TPA: BON domain-containing protein [Alphaproteobacteria bacterium]|nr:BON domain-containing protein [Alphaproteobacteria bacterium]